MRNIIRHIIVTARLCITACSLAGLLCPATGFAQAGKFTMTGKDYRDRVCAIWTAQMLGAMMGWPFEHKVASVEWVHTLKPTVDHAPVDDDWYYEMVAVRAFEKYGIDMSVQDLGRQWMENSAGTWGSSQQARLLMARAPKNRIEVRLTNTYRNSQKIAMIRLTVSLYRVFRNCGMV